MKTDKLRDGLVRVHIREDEQYPVYELENDPGMGWPFDIPEETEKRWREVLSAYDQVQVEMKALYNGTSVLP